MRIELALIRIELNGNFVNEKGKKLAKKRKFYWNYFVEKNVCSGRIDISLKCHYYPTTPHHNHHHLEARLMN